MVKKLFLAIIALICLGALAGGGAVIWVYSWSATNGPLTEPKNVIISPGTGFQTIADQLEAEGVIDQALLLKAYAALRGDHSQVKAGEYAFAAGTSPQAVMSKMVKGDAVIHAITFPEGLNSAQILMLIAQDPRLKGKVPETLPEGSLLPNTYHFQRGDQRALIIERMRKAMADEVARIWAQRAPGLPISSPEEMLVLASVVEKETGVADERPMVAGVFTNRLRQGMPLQSDPTVAYAIEREHGPMQRPLFKGDLEKESPYNTYLNAGLPPTPICHPGSAALEAVARPAETTALYFVATGVGGHYFADSLAEHNRNVAKYRAALRGQGQ